MKKATASMALKRYELVETWHILVLSCVIPCYNDSTLSRGSIRSLRFVTIDEPIEGILAHIVPVAGGSLLGYIARLYKSAPGHFGWVLLFCLKTVLEQQLCRFLLLHFTLFAP